MTIHLANQHWDIEIDPENGSLFRQCRYMGKEVFRDFQETNSSNEFPQYSASNFPLLPFSNRIKDGRFEFRGKSHRLPVNATNQTHPLHGYGWIMPWEVTSSEKGQIALTQKYEPGDWPWAYEAQQAISVMDNTFRMELSLINKSHAVMPAGIGFHPYFPDLEHASLVFDSDAVWMADEEVLPTERMSPPGSYDLSKTKPLKSANLDHCYEGVGSAHITWSNSPLKLTIISSDNLSRAAVYTAHSDNCFCFEPISHTHNAINMDDSEAEGLVFLQPGESLSAWCEIRVDLP